MLRDDLQRVLSQEASHAEPAVREVAAERLGFLGGGGALELVVRLLDDPSLEVRSSAVAALGDLRDQRAVPHLVDLLKRARSEDDGEVLMQAVLSLQVYDHCEIRDQLLVSLSKENLPAAVRMKAVQQLWRYPGDGVRQALANIALTDPNLTTQANAAEALAFQDRFLGSPDSLTPIWNQLKASRVASVAVIARRACWQSEYLEHQRFTTHAEARAVVFTYVETFYNRVRLHSNIGYRPPNEFEQMFKPAA